MVHIRGGTQNHHHQNRQVGGVVDVEQVVGHDHHHHSDAGDDNGGQGGQEEEIAYDATHEGTQDLGPAGVQRFSKAGLNGGDGSQHGQRQVGGRGDAGLYHDHGNDDSGDCFDGTHTDVESGAAFDEFMHEKSFLLDGTFVLDTQEFSSKITMFFQKILKINLSEKLKISLILFIAGAQIFGTVLEFYHKFLWWDTMLHFVSGIIFYFVGESVIKWLNDKTTKANISTVIIIAFSIFFALSSGVVWEIFEFTVDISLGQNMQITTGLSGRDAVMDTMVDLISLTLGTIVISLVDIYIKKN